MATNYWKDLIGEEEARTILGNGEYLHAISRGKTHCSFKRTEAWRMGDAKQFAAYDCAERAAPSRLSCY